MSSKRLINSPIVKIELKMIFLLLGIAYLLELTDRAGWTFLPLVEQPCRLALAFEGSLQLGHLVDQAQSDRQEAPVLAEGVLGIQQLAQGLARQRRDARDVQINPWFQQTLNLRSININMILPVCEKK